MVAHTEHKKVSFEILSQLKHRLYEGSLKAGDKLPPERDLAERLGYSRAAVREAVRCFEILGLLRCVQGDGNYIASDLRNCLVEPMDFMFALTGNIRQAQEFRHSLERETVQLAAARCTGEQAARLNALLESLAVETDETVRSDLDRRLHYTIAEIADNPYIISTLNAISHLIDNIITGVRISLINDPERIDSIDAQHKAVVAAIIRHDAKEAAMHIDEHMLEVMNYLETVIIRL